MKSIDKFRKLLKESGLTLRDVKFNECNGGVTVYIKNIKALFKYNDVDRALYYSTNKISFIFFDRKVREKVIEHFNKKLNVGEKIEIGNFAIEKTGEHYFGDGEFTIYYKGKEIKTTGIDFKDCEFLDYMDKKDLLPIIEDMKEGLKSKYGLDKIETELNDINTTKNIKVKR